MVRFPALAGGPRPLAASTLPLGAASHHVDLETSRLPAHHDHPQGATLRPIVDDGARAAIDAVEVPVSVTAAVRDRDGRLLDFRLVAVNTAAAAWAGLERAAIHGRLATDLLPGLRPTGLFDELDQVVTTGRPFRQRGRFEGSVETGRHFAGIFEVMAIRHGDGYLGAWVEQDDDAGAAIDLERTLRHIEASVPLGRLEAASTSLRLQPAT